MSNFQSMETPSAPPQDEVMEGPKESGNDHVYPQLNQPGANEDIVAMNENIVAAVNGVSLDDDEKKLDVNEEDSIPYEMCEGISSMKNINAIELQPEGGHMAMSPKVRRQKSAASFKPKEDKKKPFKASEMNKKLNDSMGLFKNKSKRIAAFTEFVLSTNTAQRVKFCKYYQKHNKHSLQRVIEKQFRGILRELLLFLMMSEAELCTKWIEVALKKKDVNLLTLIICTQDNKTLQDMKKLFDSQNAKSMTQKVDGLTSNLFHKRNINKFLLALLECNRSTDEEEINFDLVEKDVNHLMLASKSKEMLDKETYIKIFTRRSFEHLYFVSKSFEERNKTKLIDTVKKLWKESSETGYAITVTLYFATRTNELFSKMLAESINQPGPNYVVFLRLIVERSEKDLSDVIGLYGRNAMQQFIDLTLHKRDADAAVIVRKLCGF